MAASVLARPGQCTETDGSGWPDPTPGADPPEPHAEVSGDAVNPLLRLWYGPSEAPVAELTPPILVTMVLSG